MTTDLTEPLLAPHCASPFEPRSRGDRRLTVISNREPYQPSTGGGGAPWQRTTGGLVSALDPVMRSCGGTWIAWNPEGGDEVLRARVPGEGPSFTQLQVPLSREEVELYYEGFANRALWPLFHSFVDRCHFDPEQWREYRRINERFARALAAEPDADGLVWIHDYHFCLLPDLARERGHAGPIAFFLHIPFPSPEIFQVLPWRRRLLEGMLGADLVGFHCASYARDFLGSCQRFLEGEARIDAKGVEWRGRRVEVITSPIGIEVAEFDRRARDPEIVARSEQLRRDLGPERVILGVDRLDYTKGIPERLEAIDELFERHPEHRRKVTFVQIAVPSRDMIREYREIKSTVDELVGRINGRHGDAGWQPIRYSNESLDRDELVAHYLAADVCLVTPLRDGMNLVALEFCASRPDRGGVLVLSELAGAAELLGEAALVVNPYAVRDVAETLHRALAMTPAERARRMDQARRLVTENDVHRWVGSMLGAVRRLGPGAG